MNPTELQIMQVLSLFCATETASEERSGIRPWMQKPFRVRDKIATTDGISCAYMVTDNFNFPKLDADSEARMSFHLVMPACKEGEIDVNDLDRKLLVFENERGGCRIGESVFALNLLQKLVDAANILDTANIELLERGKHYRPSIFGIGDFRFMLMPLKLEMVAGEPQYDYLFKLHLEEE